jgi:hypothetical protein
MWVIPFHSLYSPIFLGVLWFIYFSKWLAGFHHFLAIFHQKEKGLVRCRTYITQGDDEKKEKPLPSPEWHCAEPQVFR